MTVTEAADRIEVNLQLPPAPRLLITQADLEIIVKQTIGGEFSRVAPLILVQLYKGNDQGRRELPANWLNDFSVVREIAFDRGLVNAEPWDRQSYKVTKADETKRSIAAASAGATQITLLSPEFQPFFQIGSLVEISDATKEEFNWVKSNTLPGGVLELFFTLTQNYILPANVNLKTFLDLTAWVPDNGDFFNVSYTQQHPQTLSTLSPKDEEAFLNAAGAEVCYALAGKFTQHTPSAFLSDSTDYQDLARKWEGRGDKLHEKFLAHFGMGVTERKRGALAIMGVNQKRVIGRPQYDPNKAPYGY